MIDFSYTDAMDMVKSFKNALKNTYTKKDFFEIVDFVMEQVRLNEKNEITRKMIALMNNIDSVKFKYSVFVMRNSSNSYDIFLVKGGLPLPNGLKCEDDLINALLLNLGTECYVLEKIILEDARRFVKALYIYDRNSIERYSEDIETNSLPNYYHSLYTLEEMPSFYDYICSQSIIVEKEVVPLDLDKLGNIKNNGKFEHILYDVLQDRFFGTNIRVIK